jgi:predicted nucleic acid-binding protein
MSDKFFIDTNIFVYCFDDRQPEKKVRALALISDALQTGKGIISWQVMQEFLNVSTRKFATPLKSEDAKVYLQKVLHPLCQVFPDLDLYCTALDIQTRTEYSFYDSLIIAGAMRGGCTILYTEDLHTGHQVDRVKFVNPFC